jgi:hypothetical protein
VSTLPSTLGPEAEVQLDVFSGRRNPHWTLSGEPLREVERRLDGLPEAEERPEPPGLGYRGFLIGGSRAQVRAFRSVITVMREGRTSAFKDERRLEAHLLDQAREHGYAELLEKMGATAGPLN